jgi:type IV secretion system protein VirD4
VTASRRGTAGRSRARAEETLGIVALGLVAAWRLAAPVTSRLRSLPAGTGAGAISSALVAAAALTAVAAFMAWRHRSRARRPLSRRSGQRSATWADVRQLGPLRVPSALPGRLVLGRSGRHLLAAERGQSVIVIGPTQSQKTTGFAVPAILEWVGPVLATSVKTDLVRDTMAWRAGQGSVLVYDPAGATGLPSAGWSPLAASSTWTGARRVAAGLCSVARGRGGGLEDAGFWYAMAEKLLAPLLFGAATVGADIADVVRWVDTGEISEVELALQLAGVAEAIQAARASFAREDRQRGSVYSTAESVLEAFADPAVAASARVHEIDPARLLDGGAHTLYVCAPAHEQDRLQPVFVTVVRQLIEAALERSCAAGQPLDPPLLVVLDEAANVAPIADLDGLASTAAGHGIQLVTVFQDLAQIETRYGSRAGTVVNNHRAKVVLSGISDPSTLEHMSRLAGDEELWLPATTVDADGRRSRTESPLTRPLAPAAWLRRIAPGEGMLLYGHLPPARIGLRPWFSDAGLAARGGRA